VSATEGPDLEARALSLEILHEAAQDRAEITRLRTALQSCSDCYPKIDRLRRINADLLAFAHYVLEMDPDSKAPLFERARAAIAKVEQP
jgi:hypothetical protein